MADSPCLAELPYPGDGSRLFEPVAHWPWSVFLDSGPAEQRHGRYDIIAANPVSVLLTRGGLTEIRHGRDAVLSGNDPLRLLATEMGPIGETPESLPLAGGAIGYFAYDLAHRLERHPRQAQGPDGMPEMAVGLYDWVIVVDHEERQAWLAGQGRNPETKRLWPELLRLFSRPNPVFPRTGFRLNSDLRSAIDGDGYRALRDQCMWHLETGECQHLTLTRYFSAAVSGDPWGAYKRMRALNPVEFGAFLQLPHCAVLCNSSERFQQLIDGHVEAWAVAGSRARSDDQRLDRELARSLRRSPAHLAYSRLQTTLLSGELAQCCIEESIRRNAPLEPHSSSHSHHLLKRITAELRSTRSALDLLRHCFPAISVTGSPRLRAMQIIDELESHRRGIYGGAIGYLGYNGNMDMNMALNTAVQMGGNLRLWACSQLITGFQSGEDEQETAEAARTLIQRMASRRTRHANH